MTDATDVALEKAFGAYNDAARLAATENKVEMHKAGLCAAIEAYQAALPKGELAAQLNEYANDIGQGAILRRDLNAVIRCLRAAASLLGGGVPEGYVLVPVEPTEKMLLKGHHQIHWCRGDQNTYENDHESQRPGTTCKEDLQDAWRAMIAARPPQSGRE